MPGLKTKPVETGLILTLNKVATDFTYKMKVEEANPDLSGLNISPAIYGWDKDKLKP